MRIVDGKGPGRPQPKGKARPEGSDSQAQGGREEYAGSVEAPLRLSIQAPTGKTVRMELEGGEIRAQGAYGEKIAIAASLGANGTLRVDPEALTLFMEAAEAEPVQPDGPFNPLEHVSQETMGPMADMLSWSPEEARDKLAERQPEVHEWAVHRNRFTRILKAALTKTEEGPQGKKTVVARSNDEKLALLREIQDFWVRGDGDYTALTAAYNDHHQEGDKEVALPAVEDDDRRLYPDEMTMIVQGYKGLGAWEDMVGFYEHMRKAGKTGRWFNGL